MNLRCATCGAQRVVRNVNVGDWYRPGVYFWPGCGFALASLALLELWFVEGGAAPLAGAALTAVCAAALVYWSFPARAGFRVERCAECGTDDGLRVRPWSL